MKAVALFSREGLKAWHGAPDVRVRQTGRRCSEDEMVDTLYQIVESSLPSSGYDTRLCVAVAMLNYEYL